MYSDVTQVYTTIYSLYLLNSHPIAGFIDTEVERQECCIASLARYGPFSQGLQPCESLYYSRTM